MNKDIQKIPIPIAIKRAEEWWDRTGRRIMRKRVNEEEIGRRVRVGGNAPAIVTQGAMQPVLSSGILQCLEWSQLSRREQAKIVQVWRDFHHPEAELVRSQETRETMGRLRLQ